MTRASPDHFQRVLFLCLDTSAGTSLEHGLAAAGYQVELRAWAGAGNLCVATAPPDVILVDARLLNRDGFGVLRALRAATSRHSTGILILATEPPRDVVEAGRHLDDFDSIIENPDSLDEVKIYLKYLLRNLRPGDVR